MSEDIMTTHPGDDPRAIPARRGHKGARRGLTGARPVAAATIAAALLALSPMAAQAQDWRTTTIMRQATDETQLEVEVGYGAGHLSISPADGRMLYQATVRYDAYDFDPIAEYSSGRLRLGVDGHHNWDVDDNDDDEGGSMALRLGRDVTLDMDLEFGAAMADIELGGLSVRRLEVSTGASETRIRFSEPNQMAMERLVIEVGAADFSMRGLGHANVREVELSGGVADMELDFGGEWRGNTNLNVDFGLGSVTLRVPRGVGVRLRKDTFLASFDGPRMSRRGDVYYSDDWEDATRRLTVEVDGAFGDISIDWID